MFKLLRAGVIASLFPLFSIAPASANDNGIASVIHTLRSEKAQVCMVGHFHHGKSPRAFSTRQAAYKAAIHHWVTFTVAEYGTDWGNYGRGANRAADCEKASRTSWTCRVKARPCRRGLSVARR